MTGVLPLPPMTAMNLVVLLAFGGAFAAMGLFSLGVALARERPPIRPTPASISVVGACIAMGVLSVLVGTHGLREALDARAGVARGTSPGEWRIGEEREAVQGATLRPTEPNVNLAVGVICINGIVTTVAVGWQRSPGAPGGVVGDHVVSIDGGPNTWNRWELPNLWSTDRDPPRTPRGEPLDGPSFLLRLAGSTRVRVDYLAYPDDPVLMSATFNGTALPATLARMDCQLP